MNVDRMAGRRAGGIVVAVMDTTRTTTLRRGDLGVDDAVAAERVIFEIGSVTKTFTATLLALLAERGTVRLDTPVQDLLPAGVVMPRIRRPVTLADLAGHTSGLPRLPAGWIRRAWRHLDNPYAAFTLDDLWAAVHRGRGQRAPGRVRYSNVGAGLLGHLLERAAGTSYADLLAGEICRPLGLPDTSVTVPQATQDRLAPGRTARGRPTPGWDFPVLTGAGGLHSTAADLLTFLQAQWTTPSAPDSDLARAIRVTHTVRARGQVSVGLGWLAGRDDLLWHNGGTGGYRSYVSVNPALRRGVVVLANSARSVDRLGARLAADPQAHASVERLRSGG